MRKSQLVIITGPIGGGKSSTAIAVTRLLRAEGIATATIDLDDIYLMGRPDFTPEGWGATRRGAGTLANQFLVDGHKIVIVEGGDFRTEGEFSEMVRCVPRADRVIRITLLVSYEEVRRNVIADPNRDRVPSANPGRFYKRYIEALPYLRSHTV
jgi:hypothetical protein